MTPSKLAKQLGCKSLRQVSEVSGKSEQTLSNWFKSNTFVFTAVCEKVARESS